METKLEEMAQVLRKSDCLDDSSDVDDDSIYDIFNHDDFPCIIMWFNWINIEKQASEKTLFSSL